VKDIVHSDHCIIKGTLFEKVLNEHNFEFVVVWLYGLCILNLLSCYWAANYGSDLVTSFESRD
jgi:hypothetical protein